MKGSGSTRWKAMKSSKLGQNVEEHGNGAGRGGGFSWGFTVATLGKGGEDEELESCQALG